MTHVLGEGGMGTVYAAQDASAGRRVAIKVCHAEFAEKHKLLRRFQEEARALARVQHDHLVKVRRVGKEAGYYYYVMDFIEGRTLEQLIEAEGPLPVHRAVEMLGQIMSALAAVHRAGIIHRDLKPGNVMITPEDRAILMDFGVAKSWDRETLTTLGAILGTPEYMAPEQAQGGRVDARTDIYGLGALFYHTLTGHPPFHGKSTITIIRSHIEDTVPSVRASRADLPHSIDGIIQRAMAKTQNARYATIAEMAEDLLSLHQTDALSGLARTTAIHLRQPAEQETPSAQQPVTRTLARPPREETRPVWPRWALLVAGLLLLLLALVMALWPKGEPRDVEIPPLRDPPSKKEKAVGPVLLWGGYG